MESIETRVKWRVCVMKDRNYICFGSSITAPQDAHTRLMLQVYPGSNTLGIDGERQELYVLWL